jgi:hypothetical protein
MAYSDVAEMAVTAPLQNRVTACAATEGEQYPPVWMSQNIWRVVAAPGWSDAWASAIAGGQTPEEAGDNPGVITDGMILSSVQAIRTEQS